MPLGGCRIRLLHPKGIAKTALSGVRASVGMFFRGFLLRSVLQSRKSPCERERYSFHPRAQAALRRDKLQAIGESGTHSVVAIVDIVVVAEVAVVVHVRRVVLIVVVRGAQPPITAQSLQYRTQNNALQRYSRHSFF